MPRLDPFFDVHHGNLEPHPAYQPWNEKKNLMVVAHMGRFNIMRPGGRDHLARGLSRSLRVEWAGRGEHQAVNGVELISVRDGGC